MIEFALHLQNPIVDARLLPAPSPRHSEVDNESSAAKERDEIAAKLSLAQQENEATNKTFARLELQLNELHAALSHQSTQVQQAVIETSRKMLEMILQTDDELILERALRHVNLGIQKLSQESLITIGVHPSLLNRFKERLSHHGPVSVVADKNLEPGDCFLSTGEECIATNLASQLDRVVQHVFAALEDEGGDDE